MSPSRYEPIPVQRDYILKPREATHHDYPIESKEAAFRMAYADAVRTYLMTYSPPSYNLDTLVIGNQEVDLARRSGISSRDCAEEIARGKRWMVDEE